ncbi:MAG: RluA family pseudouridine synthase [Clostridia bacterium]|nr:RluA family pseudouridine synthase [Clostridia bacterium]
MTILYRDSQLLVCEKPSGTLSEGDSPKSLPRILGEQLGAEGEPTDIFPVHRLDKETTGLMVFARTTSAAGALSRSITQGNFHKEYLALVCGRPTEASGCLTDLLFYDRARGKSFVVDRTRKGVKEAILSYTLMGNDERHSLLRITLHTGRTHQIRAQFASRGMPLAGDRRYGAPPEGMDLMLHAATLSFPHPVTKKNVCFTSVPPWENLILKKLEIF